MEGERNIAQRVKSRKANWKGRKCLLKRIIEGEIRGRI
jgi:hypothetical protein